MDLTSKTHEAISAAQQRAVRDGNPQLEPAHLLLALLDQAESIPAALLAEVGATPAAVRADAESAVARLPRAAGTTVSGAPGVRRPCSACSPTRRSARRRAATPTSRPSTSSSGSPPSGATSPPCWRGTGPPSPRCSTP